MGYLIDLYSKSGSYLGSFDCERVIPIRGDIIITDIGKYEVIKRELNYESSEIKLIVNELKGE